MKLHYAAQNKKTGEAEAPLYILQRFFLFLSLCYDSYSFDLTFAEIEWAVLIIPLYPGQ